MIFEQLSIWPWLEKSLRDSSNEEQGIRACLHAVSEPGLLGLDPGCSSRGLGMRVNRHSHVKHKG